MCAKNHQEPVQMGCSVEPIHFFDDKVSLDDNTYTHCHNPLCDEIINVTL